MAARPKFLAVKNWDKLQHHKDGRTLPWIKLYDRLLDDYEFAQLSEAAQLHLIKIWMFANRRSNKIPNDGSFIRTQIHAKGSVNLDELRAKGFLITWREPKETAVLQEENVAELSRLSLESVKTESRAEQSRAEESSSKGSSSTEGSSGAAIFPMPGKAEAVEKLIVAVRQGDENTPATIRGFQDLPEAVFRETLEELERCRAKIRQTDAQFVVGILKDRRGRQAS